MRSTLGSDSYSNYSPGSTMSTPRLGSSSLPLVGFGPSQSTTIPQSSQPLPILPTKADPGTIPLSKEAILEAQLSFKVHFLLALGYSREGSHHPPWSESTHFRSNDVASRGEAVMRRNFSTSFLSPCSICSFPSNDHAHVALCAHVSEGLSHRDELCSFSCRTMRRCMCKLD